MIPTTANRLSPSFQTKIAEQKHLKNTQIQGRQTSHPMLSILKISAQREDFGDNCLAAVLGFEEVLPKSN
jgi:hypothetical protein